MAKRIAAGVLMLTIGFAALPAAFAQDKDSPQPVQDWQSLRGLKPGTVIVVYTTQGKEIEGKFADLKGSILGLTFGFEVLDFDQRDITEVRRKPSRRKGRIIGTVIGTLAGAMLAAGVTAKIEENLKAPQETSALGSGMLGMAGGGSLGYAIGLRFDNKRKGKLLYKSP